MEELIEKLEAYAQYETMVDRGEFVDTMEEAMAYSRGKADGRAYLARLVLKILKEKDDGN